MLSWQVPLRDVAGTSWPVAIVGCGPAGALAALHLARRGVRVVAVEKQRFPRDKVCGDALIPDAIRALDRAGLLDEVRARGREAHRLMLYSPSRLAVPVQARALTIARTELDAILAHAAARAGATVAQGAVRAIERDGGEVRIRFDDAEPIVARIAVVATGADIRLLREVATFDRRQASAVAVRRYIRSSAAIDDLVISFDRSIVPGYAWIFPMPEGVYNVGCGIVYDAASRARADLSHKLDSFLREFPAAREIMSAASDVGPLRGATLRTGLAGLRGVHAPNVLAIGECIGTTYPLSGEGIGKAMETGELAADVVARALEADDLSLLGQFAERLVALRPLYDAYAAGEAWLARPWLNDAIARLARRSAYARRAFSEILAETTTPRAIFSVRGVVRMLTG